MRGGDVSDDDSFQSANEYMTDEEANRRVQEVQYTLKQRESMRTKLMTELRFNEGGTGTSNTLYKALEEELQACDREISHLQVAYVEALMNLGMCCHFLFTSIKSVHMFLLTCFACRFLYSILFLSQRRLK